MPASDRLIECVLFINQNKQITRTLPPTYRNESITKSVAEFCFPWKRLPTAPNLSSDDGPAKVQEFTFVQTQQDVNRYFGFVRLNRSAQSCVVLISKKFSWSSTFLQLLRVLDNNYSSYNGEGDSLFSLDNAKFGGRSVFEMSVDDIEAGVQVCLPLGCGQELQVISPDSQYLPRTDASQHLLEFIAFYRGQGRFHRQRMQALIKLYSSVMHERVVIVMGSNLSILTSILHSITQLIFPLQWQHMFTPILPAPMIQYVGAPFPAIIGVHSSLLDDANSFLDHSNAFILDLDQQSDPVVNDPFNDEKSIPGEVISFLQEKLEKVHMQGDDLSQIFLSAQAKLLAGYHSRFVIDLDKKFQYNFDEFSTIRRKWIMKQRHPYFQTMITLQCFKQFIDMQIDALNSNRPPQQSAIFEDAVRRVEDDNQLTAGLSFAKARARNAINSRITSRHKSADNGRARSQSNERSFRDSIQSGKITSDLIGAPVLVTTTNKNVREEIRKSRESSNERSDKVTVLRAKAKSRPWVDDKAASRFKERHDQLMREKNGAGSDLATAQTMPTSSTTTTVISPIHRADTTGPHLPPKLPPKPAPSQPELISFNNSETRHSLGRISLPPLSTKPADPLAPPQSLSPTSPAPTFDISRAGSISTRPITALQNLNIQTFSEDLLKMLDHNMPQAPARPSLNASESTKSCQNLTVLEEPVAAPRSKPAAAGFAKSQSSLIDIDVEALYSNTVREIESRRTSSADTAPTPKPRNGWVQFE